jgi:hypothetical protein
MLLRQIVFGVSRIKAASIILLACYAGVNADGAWARRPEAVGNARMAALAVAREMFSEFHKILSSLGTRDIIGQIRPFFGNAADTPYFYKSIVTKKA